MLTEYNKRTGRLVVNLFGFRLKFHMPVKSKNINERFENLFYELADPRTLQSVKMPKIASLYDSLYALVNSDKSLARFGDGEFKLMMGESINFQKYDNNLKKRLEEIILNKSDNIMVGLPDCFGYCESDYFRKVIVNCREYLYNYLNFSKEYYDASITRKFKFKTEEQGNDYYNLFKKLWEGKDVVIVEGFGSRLGVGNDLFSGAKSIKRILCPIKNAFSKYDEILNACRAASGGGQMFVIALGPTATVLAYDLAQDGTRALDMGHIDTMYECFLRKSDKLIPIEGKIVFNKERNEHRIPECNDENYYKQIIAEIK